MCNLVLRIATPAYRFFASLKLAVFSLTTLAAVLAYATFFESRHGTHATQEWIYRSPAFALLLAFLGLNVLCAALIRFRWDERQHRLDPEADRLCHHPRRTPRGAARLLDHAPDLG